MCQKNDGSKLFSKLPILARSSHIGFFIFNSMLKWVILANTVTAWTWINMYIEINILCKKKNAYMLENQLKQIKMQ